jgi:hypothetical protein
MSLLSAEQFALILSLYLSIGLCPLPERQGYRIWLRLVLSSPSPL